MKSEMQVHLHKIRLFGFHGLAEGESVFGGEFEVSLTIHYKSDTKVIKKIKDTIDYTVLLSIVKSRMKEPAYLLETLATDIAKEVFKKFSIATRLMISISKLNPPIENFEGSVGVTLKLKRN